jgi:RNase P/RNase MRP subunit POP5
MVRFKNRYILADYQDVGFNEPPTEKSFLKMLKERVEEMMGQLFLAKVTFSLQIKYLNLGKVLIRAPRDHATQILACLFIIPGLKVIRVSGTIRNIQKKIFQLLRKELRRELSATESDLIEKIDYS